MPLYSDPGYYYSTGGSSGIYSSAYSAPYYTTSSPYISSSYGRPYSIPSLSSYSSASSRYQPKLSTITETPLGGRGLIPLTRLNSPKVIPTSSYHHTSKYIPPRPININTADIDVSASRYRRHDTKSSPKLTTTQIIDTPPPIQPPPSSQPSSLTTTEQQSQQTSSFMPRADGSDPSPLNRSTIKRNRAVVRLSTVRSKSIRNRSIPRDPAKQQNVTKDDDRKKPKIEPSELKDSQKMDESQIKDNLSVKSNEPESKENLSASSSSWRDKFGDDLLQKPYGVVKKSPGELLLERYIIPSKYNDQVIVNSISVPDKEENVEIDPNNEIIIELDPIMQSEIRRLSIPKCPDFQDFCEDISSDKIDDDLNAGELRRRASIIQEQEIELFNKLQKSASGSFQLIHLERNESNADLSCSCKSTKRKSLSKKSKKVRHKITATVDIQNPTLTPILQESLEDDSTNVVEVKSVKPKFTFNVDEIEENHTIHKIFKLPKKKSNENIVVKKVEEKIDKTLEKIELKKGIKNSPKKVKITKKTEPIKGVKISPKKNVKIETAIIDEERANQLSTIEKMEDEIFETVTEMKVISKENIEPGKLEKSNSKSESKIEELNFSKAEPILNKQEVKDEGTASTKTPVMRRKPKPLEILKSKTTEEIKTVSPSLVAKSPFKSFSASNVDKSDISSKITKEHFKFDDDSIAKTEIQSPKMRIRKSGKQPISPLAIDRSKDESSVSVAQPKPIVGQIQRSDSGEDFWSQIGTRETLYMSNRKRNELESQWLKRETLLDNQNTDEVKNLKEIKSIVHDQKSEALKQADEQNQSAELGKRAHSNESALCVKKKGLVKEEDSVEDKNIPKISENKTEQVKSKEIPKKIPDTSETYKKLNQPLQLPTPTDSEKINTKITTKLLEQKQQYTTANIPKIETGLKAKSPEIKSKEIDLNKNKLDPQKSAPPSPEVVSSVSTIKTDVAANISTPKTTATNNSASDGLKKKTDDSKKQNETENSEKSINKKSEQFENSKISPKKLTTNSEVNNSKIHHDKTTKENTSPLLAKSKENVSLQKLPTTTSSSSSSSVAITTTDDNNKQQKKISPPTTLKTLQSPAAIKLSTNTDAKISLTTDKNKKLTEELEKIGKIPDKNICDANSIDKIQEKIPNKNEEKEQQNQQYHEEHQLSCKNVLMKANLSNLSKFATVNNLNQCLLDVDADIEDIKSDSENSSSSYSSNSSDNNNNKSDSMKRKDKKNKHKHQPKEEKQFNRNKIKLDHTKKCYVKDEAPPYPLIATPRPLWKPEKFIIPESDSDDDDSDTDSSDNDGGSGANGSDNDSSTSSGTSDDEYDNELNPNKSAIIRMSTCSNDSGFEGGTAPSSPKKMLDCDVNCHKKCEKLTANLCGVNQKLIVEALLSVRRGADARDSPSTPPSYNPAYKIESNYDDYDETSYTYAQFQKSGRITAPATNIPRFKKYSVEDFHFLTVLGKGSFGKVLLAELRNTDYYYAVKCLKKDVVLEDDDVECTLIERKVLALGTKHPYLCHLFCTFQTESHLFFVMEYLNGGDLMFHIQQSGRFPEPRARFYAAEIISGLKFLHKKGIIYRDLKLDNVLLDFDGHVRIADFGMCKLQIYLDKTADSFCGTPDYMAPEIIKGDNYNQNVDWWSFGVLLYEMLIGQSPFSGCDEEYLFWSICNEMPLYPLMLSHEATSLLKALLEKDSSKRIGSQYSPAGDICAHPFFNQIEWDRLEKRQIEPPFKPQVKHPLDTQYFDKTFTRERVRLTPIDKEILQSMDQAQFQGFSYTNPNATLE